MQKQDKECEMRMVMNSTSASKHSLKEKHPLVLFFVFAYFFFIVFLLIIGPIKNFVLISETITQILVAVASWTPNIAAILVVKTVQGKGEVSALLNGWKKWRVSIIWYLAGIIPLVIAFSTVGISSLLNGKTILVKTGINWAIFLSMVIFHFIQGSTGEELGWRAYALPKLEERYSTLASAILLGFLIAGWHSILHLLSPVGIPEWQFWLVIICYSIIVAWIYNRSSHSLLIVTLFHFSFNFSLELVVTRLSLISLPVLFSLYVGIYALLALVVITLGGKKFIGYGAK